MKTLFLYIFLMLGIGGFGRIAEINRQVQQGEISYKKGQFAAAVQHFEKVVYEHNQKKPEILLNLAHAYRKNNQAEKAQQVYEQCLKSENPYLRSIAWEQLGTLQTQLPDFQKALTFYKRALVANPENEQARYNYELLKKYLRQNPEKQDQLPPPAPEKQEKQDEKKPQPQKQDQQQSQSEKPDQNGDQEKENKDKQEPGNQEQKPEKQTDPKGKNQPEQEKPGSEKGQQKEQKQGEEKGQEEGQDLAQEDEKQPQEKRSKKPGKEPASGQEQRLQTQYERLRKANISPEKATMMLDAMRAAEQQYLQQLPKKPTKPADKSKPNW